MIENQQNIEKTKRPNEAQKIFERIYEQLKPPEEVALEKGRFFIQRIRDYYHLHISKVKPEETINDCLERILDKEITGTRSLFKNHILELLSKKEVDEFVIKYLLNNLLSLGNSFLYNQIIERKEENKIENEKFNRYNDAINNIIKQYSREEKALQEIFIHFNYRKYNPETNPVVNRFYITFNLQGEPAEVVSAWIETLKETGDLKNIYFKVDIGLSNRYDQLIIYQTQDVSNERMGEIIKKFYEKCSITNLGDMPSGVRIVRGLSYAPEPQNFNMLFKEIGLKKQEGDDKPMSISYNQMISAFIQLSFELAYGQTLSRKTTETIYPKDLKEEAAKYFEQFIRIAGLNPETMVPNRLSGKLPAWTEELKSQFQN